MLNEGYRMHKIIRIMTLMVLLLLCMLTLGASVQSVQDGYVEVHFIDVGQGDAILIRSANHAVLIDGGNRNTTVLDYLSSLGVQILDLVVGTHAHADHIGGLIPVLEQLSVHEVMDPAVVHTSKTFEDYLTVIDRKNIRFTVADTGLKRSYGDMLLHVLHPTQSAATDLNNSSIVIHLIYHKISFLFTGDAEQVSERAILERSGQNLASTILKVGHHGSSTSTSSEFLSQVRPEVAIFSVGEGNTYGHPHDLVIARLAAQHVDLYRTDMHGHIIIRTDGNTFMIEAQKDVEDAFPLYRIGINSADASQLKQIVHIDEVRARSLISLRPFTSLEDLARIPGIGPSRVRDIIQQGLAYVDVEED